MAEHEAEIAFGAGPGKCVHFVCVLLRTADMSIASAEQNLSPASRAAKLALSSHEA